MSVRLGRNGKPRTRIMTAEPIIISQLKMRSKFTPDFRFLRMYDRIPVLIYDDMQREGRDHYLLDGAEFLGKGITVTSTFKMFTTGRDPVVFKEIDEKHPSKGGIRGEIYNLGVEHIHVLDREYRNGDKVFRQIEKVILEDQDPECISKRYKGFPWIHCFMYIANKPLWVKSGGLRTKPLQEARGKPVIEGRKFYSWDAWEAGWEDSWGSLGVSNPPYGREFNNYPFDDDESFLNLHEWYEGKDGVWRKINDKGDDDDEWPEPHIG